MLLDYVFQISNAFGGLTADNLLALMYQSGELGKNKLTSTGVDDVLQGVPDCLNGIAARLFCQKPFDSRPVLQKSYDCQEIFRGCKVATALAGMNLQRHFPRKIAPGCRHRTVPVDPTSGRKFFDQYFPGRFKTQPSLDSGQN